jgi:hypothetical protein
MKLPVLLLTLICTLSALPASADLSLTGRSTVVAMGMQGVGQEGVWLSGSKIRRDMIDRGKAYSHLYNLDKNEITVIDHSQRQAQIYSMASINQQTNATVSSKDLKLDLKPTSRKHSLQKWTCVEHDLFASMPAEVGGEKVSFTLTGTVWLASDTAEQKEVAAFIAAAKNPDFFMGIPTLAKSSPAQARGMSEIVRRMAPNGLLCAVDVQTKYAGTGRMAALSNKLNSRISLTYEQYGTNKLKSEVFDIPKGYRIERK